jgi:hypothetical protein
MDVVNSGREADNGTIFDSDAQVVPRVTQELCPQRVVNLMIENAGGDVAQDVLVTGT